VTEQEHARLPERVARIESDIHGLREAIRGVSTQVTEMGETFKAAVVDVRRQIPSGRTDWNVIFAAAVVILMVVGLVGGVIAFGFDRTIGALTAEVGAMQDRELDTAYARGRSDEKVDQNIAHLDHLDTTLQREMRDLDVGLRADIRAEIGAAASARERLTQAAEMERRIRAWVEGRP
jgi:hypothetical protein